MCGAHGIIVAPAPLTPVVTLDQDETLDADEEIQFRSPDHSTDLSLFEVSEKCLSDDDE